MPAAAKRPTAARKSAPKTSATATSPKTPAAAASSKASATRSEQRRERSRRAADLACIERADVLVQNRISFVDHPKFKNLLRRKTVPFQELPPESPERANVRRSKFLADMPSHLARMCERPLLTGDEEQELFFRMNFLKFRAAVLIKRLERQRPTAEAVEEIENVLSLAGQVRDQILESNMRLVISIVKKFVSPNNSFDDLLSEGIVSLVRAVENFDHARGFRFSTYATQVVRRNVFHLISRRQRELNRFRSGSEETLMESEHPEPQSELTVPQWASLRDKFAAMMDRLDRRERFIIRCRFALGSHRRVRTFQDLADKLGVSKERVRQLEQRALGKLRICADEYSLKDDPAEMV